MITHRCKGSLAAEVSIRYGYRFNPRMIGDKPAWRMWKPETDSEWMTCVLCPITEISYCPFCGKKLEEPVPEIERVE